MANQNGGAGADCSEMKKATAPGRNSWTLSWLAETADGWRDEELKLVLHPTEGLSIRRQQEALLEGETEVCCIETPSCQPDRERVDTVILETRKSGPKRIDSAKEGWDSVFWTESAIEKFLYPYYHSQRTWSPVMDEVKASYEAYPGAFAMRHKAPSNSAVMSFEAEVEIGAVDLSDNAFRWYSPQKFIGLVSRYLLTRAAEGREAGGRGPGTPEPAGAPPNTP